jgi:hypothetical protein
MNNKRVGGAHWSFWVISLFVLIWNGMGITMYIWQMTPEGLAALPEMHRMIIEDRPAWASLACAVAVFGGVLGGLLLLFRKSASFYALTASLIGMVITGIHTFGVVTSQNKLSHINVVMMTLMPLLVAALFIWYSRQAESRGWIS